jgi:hypothetical protein
MNCTIFDHRITCVVVFFIAVMFVMFFINLFLFIFSKYFSTGIIKCVLCSKILVVTYKMNNPVKLNDRF